ncbi:hypothetical protein HETIRDRAFT_104504 [Heterobasidion irregulare TC 32-1]|uniref:Uncharacterized protein n=1 Tax=Heterobasidion irregulare (strain TC 32-1) TaxID=747525 RepID=W4K2A9_HETIT|nr:uncharacterized protein HETIRDRAFT_104504 [Heterobasidion irregulare TC 32-1]ETW79226.1 hypothetical protein HETIRDRAFT_104504 [Heterobasidion irregulare TC 32-1]
MESLLTDFDNIIASVPSHEGVEALTVPTSEEESILYMLGFRYLGCMFPPQTAFRITQHLRNNDYQDELVNSDYGPVVEQHCFVPYIGQRREEQATSQLEDPVYFNGRIGVRLADEFKGDLDSVPNVDEPSALHGRSTVKLMIDIAFAKEASKEKPCQLQLRNGQGNPVTLRKLIEFIKRRIGKYLESDSVSIPLTSNDLIRRTLRL